MILGRLKPDNKNIFEIFLSFLSESKSEYMLGWTARAIKRLGYQLL